MDSEISKGPANQGLSQEQNNSINFATNIRVIQRNCGLESFNSLSSSFLCTGNRAKDLIPRQIFIFADKICQAS